MAERSLGGYGLSWEPPLFLHPGEVCPWAGDVDADEPFAGLFAVHGAAVHEDMLVAEQVGRHLFRGHAGGAYVHPHQVGALQARYLGLGHHPAQDVLEQEVVAMDVFVQLVQPVLTLVVGGDEPFHTEGIHVAHLVDVDGLQAASPSRLAFGTTPTWRASSKTVMGRKSFFC